MGVLVTRTSIVAGGGSFAHGDAVTITGSGFGSSPALAFAGGNQGPIETTTVGQTPANTHGGVNPASSATNPDDEAADVDDSWSWKRYSQRLIVANDAARGKVVGGTYSGTDVNPDIPVEYRFPGVIANSGKVFASFWTKVSYTPGSNGQHKIIRFHTAPASDMGGQTADVMFTNQEFNDSVVMVGNGNNGTATNQQTWYGADNSGWNDSGSVWQKTEIFLQMSSGTGNRDGKIFIRNFTGGSVPTSPNPTAASPNTSDNMNSNWLSRPANNTNQFMSAVMVNYVGNSFTGATIFQDDYFFNTTNWIRLEVWNSLTPSSATVRETQEPTSWSDNSITIRLNKGGLASGSYYLVVVDGVTDTVLASQAITIS